MPESRRKGWFILAGQDGDRTLEEQMKGLARAVEECRGKTVLDIGCAEGLIAIEFAKAGAAHVRGVDVVKEHVEVAARLAAAVPNVSFDHGKLGEMPVPSDQFDIVLALGVAHKLHEPAIGIRYAAAASRDLVLVRMSARMGPRREAHVLRSKRGTGSCNVTDEMARAGFALRAIDPGPRGETVHYYRRASA